MSLDFKNNSIFGHHKQIKNKYAKTTRLCSIITYNWKSTWNEHDMSRRPFKTCQFVHVFRNKNLKQKIVLKTKREWKKEQSSLRSEFTDSYFLKARIQTKLKQSFADLSAFSFLKPYKFPRAIFNLQCKLRFFFKRNIP